MPRNSITAAIALLLMLPIGVALAQGGGGGGGGGGGAGSGAGGAGAAGAGGGQGGTGTSARGGGNAVGGGAPAGAVGGGAPAGAVGGGAPANSNTNSSVGATPTPQQAVPTSPAGNPPTTGGVIGGYTGAPPADAKVSPPITAQSSPPIVPDGVQGAAAEQPGSRTGLAKPADNGVSTKIVPAQPCSAAAKETDGTTTCVGIPDKR